MLLQKLVNQITFIKQKSCHKQAVSSLKTDHLSKIIIEHKTTNKSAIELEIIYFEDLPR
jgi:hypothetical protein